MDAKGETQALSWLREEAPCQRPHSSKVLKAGVLARIVSPGQDGEVVFLKLLTFLAAKSFDIKTK